MLTVHHLGISQSDRVVWLCEELGLDYELVRHERDPVTRMAPETYRALHFSGTAPVIEDSTVDGGLTLAESGAVIDWIVARHGGGRLALPADHPRFADYLYWYHFANGSLMPAAMGVMAGGPVGAMMQMRIDRYLAGLDAHFAAGDAWLAGDDFTVADVMIAFPLTTMRAFVPLDLSPYPALQGYIRRLTDRPAFRKAMAKANPGFMIPVD